MLTSRQMPKTKLFPYERYDSPNIHFLTVADFENLAAQEGWAVERCTRICGPQAGRS